jgi:hypothetical protein
VPDLFGHFYRYGGRDREIYVGQTYCISHHTRVFVRAREWVCSDLWEYSREVRPVKLYDSVARERENALTAAGSDRYLPIWFLHHVTRDQFLDFVNQVPKTRNWK